MTFERKDLIADLKLLRRGFGIETADITASVGSALRIICGVTDQDGPATQRRKVRDALAKAIAELPTDLGALSTAAFGLNGTAHVRYEERIRSTVADRELRTIRRRADLVVERIADLFLERVADDRPVPRPRHPWRTRDLQVCVMLGRPVVEVFEERAVVCETDELSEVDLSVTLAPPPDWTGSTRPADLGIDVFLGGVALAHRQVASNRFRFALRPPAPLTRGQQHRFGFRLRVARAFAPYYVCTPEHPCDRFGLEVQFGGSPPERIWLLDGEFPLEIEDRWLTRPPLTASATGSVQVAFRDLELNRSYGVGWRP